MLNPGAMLRNARDAARLSTAVVARLSGLDEGVLSEAEAGRVELTAAELDRCARVFGVRLDDLLDGQAGRSPLSLLMRSSMEGQTPELGEMIATELHQGLGEFLRVVRDIADLEALLGQPAERISRLVPLPSHQGEHPGENRARTLRARLGLGISPVPSMRRIVEQDLGVRVVWVTLDHLDRSVDGACTLEPRPAVLVNLLEPERFPWRTRITLAHELCHLLFDEEVRESRALVSPYGRATKDLRIERIEQRARAFAACFLAPAEGVRRAVATAEPTSEEAIRRVGSTYGVGRTVAINRLQHVFALSDEQRLAMEIRGGQPYEGKFDPDFVDQPLGFRGGAMVDLVREALVAGKLGKTRARRFLGLTAADELPFPDLPPAQRAPLIAEGEGMRQRADAILQADPAKKGLLAARTERAGNGWKVTVVSGGVGAREPLERGYLVLSQAGELLEDHVIRPGAGGVPGPR